MLLPLQLLLMLLWCYAEDKKRLLDLELSMYNSCSLPNGFEAVDNRSAGRAPCCTPAVAQGSCVLHEVVCGSLQLAIEHKQLAAARMTPTALCAASVCAQSSCCTAICVTRTAPCLRQFVPVATSLGAWLLPFGLVTGPLGSCAGAAIDAVAWHCCS